VQAGPADAPTAAAAQAGAAESTTKAAAQKVELHYFYDEPCGSCDGTTEFYELLTEQTGDIRGSIPYAVYTHNVFSEGTEARDAAAAAQGIDLNVYGRIAYPCLMLDGKLYQGLDDIRANVREAFLAAGERLT